MFYNIGPGSKPNSQGQSYKHFLRHNTQHNDTQHKDTQHNGVSWLLFKAWVSVLACFQAYLKDAPPSLTRKH